jgi:hypothetical protein
VYIGRGRVQPVCCGHPLPLPARRHAATEPVPLWAGFYQVQFQFGFDFELTERGRAFEVGPGPEGACGALQIEVGRGKRERGQPDAHMPGAAKRAQQRCGRAADNLAADNLDADNLDTGNLDADNLAADNLDADNLAAC